MVIPIGANAMSASLMCWTPNGIPMIEIKHASAELRCPIDSYHPATRNQTTLPMVPIGPVPRSACPFISDRFTATNPNGQRENFPITKQDRDHGRPTIVTAQNRPASHHPSAIGRPPSTSHKIFNSNLNINSFYQIPGNK